MSARRRATAQTHLQEALLPDGDLRALAARPEGLKVGIVGGSMQPTLHPGQQVTVRACRYLWPGDVVLFELRDGSCAMLHRTLFEVPAAGWLVEVGDAGSRVAFQRRDQIIGRADVRRELPAVRHYLSALRHVLGAPLRLAARRVRRRTSRQDR